jgi:hypothetical protein
MRINFVLTMLVFTLSAKAQSVLPGSYTDHLQQLSAADNFRFKDSAINKKWFITKSVGITAGVAFFNGRSASIFAVPVGIQLNRKLNNNLYAFAGVSAAPAYINFNNAFITAGANKFKNTSLLQSNRFNAFSRAELGLMYVNDQKTFSISGSIGIERSSYPFVPFNQIGTGTRNSFIAPNK